MESSNDNSREWACTIRDIYGRVQHAVFTLLVISYLVSNPDKIAQGNNYIFVVMDSAGNFAKLTVRKTLTAIARTLAPGNHPLVGKFQSYLNMLMMKAHSIAASTLVVRRSLVRVSRSPNSVGHQKRAADLALHKEYSHRRPDIDVSPSGRPTASSAGPHHGEPQDRNGYPRCGDPHKQALRSALGRVGCKQVSSSRFALTQTSQTSQNSHCS